MAFPAGTEGPWPRPVRSLRDGHSGLRGEGKGRGQNGFVEDSKGISLSSSGRFI